MNSSLATITMKANSIVSFCFLPCSNLMCLAYIVQDVGTSIFASYMYKSEEVN